MSRRLIAATLVVAVAMALSGCLGPAALRETRLKYNDAYRKTTDQEILLNIVRLRYAGSPVFIDLPNITSQFQVSANGTGIGGVDGQGPGPSRLGIGEIFLKDAPTLSYTPRSGQQIGRRLMTPLTAELMRSISPGSNTAMFMMAAVDGINDLRNAPLGASLNPTVPDSNMIFRHAVEMLASLQARGGAELAMARFDGHRFEGIDSSKIRGRDVIDAARDHKIFRTEGETTHLVEQDRSLVLVIRPEELGSYEVEELTRLLKLEPGRLTYRIVSRENEEIEIDELPSPLGNDTINLDMRSLWQLMAFLSKGVSVPPEHYQRGIVSTTCGPDGVPFDWTQVTRGYFRVCVQKHRPKRYEEAVRYRGYWFYIAENDVQSRSILSLLELILELQESESEQAGPLLTLPVG